MAQQDQPITDEDLAVTLAVREDLGPGSEPAVIAEFLDRVGLAIDQRVDARVAAQRVREREGGGGPPIAFFSLIFGIPITAIASGEGVAGIALAWAGIAAVNVAHALRR